MAIRSNSYRSSAKNAHKNAQRAASIQQKSLKWAAKREARHITWMARQAERIERYRNAFRGAWLTRIGLGLVALWQFITDPPFVITRRKSIGIPVMAIPFMFKFGRKESRPRPPRFASSSGTPITVETLEKRELLAADITGVSLSNNFMDVSGTGVDTATTTSTTPTISGTANANSEVTLDYTGDGKGDAIVVVNNAGNWSYTLPSTGFKNPIAVIEGVFSTTSFTAQDSVSITVETSTPTGFFTPGQVIPNSGFARGLGIADFDGDGKLDLYVGTQGADQVYLGNGLGGFGSQITPPEAQDGVNKDSAFGDLNGDGKVDAFLSFENHGHNVSLNTSTPESLSFTTSSTPNSGGGSRGIALGDIDGDGDIDAFVGKSGGDDLLINNGSGVFIRPGTQTFSNLDTLVAEFADFDGDGDLDLFLVHNSPVAPHEVWLNNGSGVFSKVTTQSSTHGFDLLTPSPGQNIAIGDVNGDGILDVVVPNFDLMVPDQLFIGAGDGTFSQKVDLGSTGAKPLHSAI